MSLAVVQDMRETRVRAGAEEAAALETDVLAGFVLARAAAGLSDSTISGCAFGISTALTGGGKYDPDDIRFQILQRFPLRSESNSAG